MAFSATLQLTDNFNRDILFEDAYVKVSQFTGDKNTVLIVYCIYDAKDKNQLEERRVTFFLDLEGPNPIKQAYLHLKSLPEFADAVDC
jgi:hypothetical protein